MRWSLECGKASSSISCVSFSFCLLLMATVSLIDGEYSSPSFTVHAHTLNKPRFRAVPTYGKDTIRKFAVSVSSLKRIAGHDFEDILQVRSYL